MSTSFEFHAPSSTHWIPLKNTLPLVATALWAKCEGEAHTPKSGNLESSGTPENSELELKVQNTLNWGVLGVIRKFLKCRFLKCPRIGHLHICNPSYGRKKGRESNWQFDSRPLKVGIRPLPDVQEQCATWRWKALEESYNFGSNLVSIQTRGEKLWMPKVPRVQTGTVSGLHLGSLGKKSHLDVASARSCREYYKGEGGGFPPSLGRGVSCESELAHGLSQHQMHAEWLLTNSCWFWMQVAWSLRSLIPELPTRPLYPF
jgi:hypothetical protein